MNAQYKRMTMRTAKIIACSMIFLVCSFLAIVNIYTGVTIIAFTLAILSVFYFMSLTNGFHVGFLERLNTDRDSAMDAIRGLFASAKESIQIVSGTFPKEIYLNEEVFKAFKDAKERGVSITILIEEPKLVLMCFQEGDSADVDMFLSWIKNEEITVKSIKKSKPHFMVVDSLHVRIEEGHAQRKACDQIDKKRRAKISYLDPYLGQRYQRRFRKINGKSSNISLVGSQ